MRVADDYCHREKIPEETHGVFGEIYQSNWLGKQLRFVLPEIAAGLFQPKSNTPFPDGINIVGTDPGEQIRRSGLIQKGRDGRGRCGETGGFNHSQGTRRNVIGATVGKGEVSATIASQFGFDLSF